MANEGIDQDELSRFEVALVQELAKRGFEMILIGDELTFESLKTKRRGSANLVTFFKVHKGGKSVEEVADQITGMLDTLASPAPQVPGEKPQPRFDLDRLYPLIKGPDFIMAYHKTLETRLGANLPPNHPSMPVVFRYAKDHEVYILCGFDIGTGYAYLMNGVFNEYSISESDLFKRMMQNLVRKMDAIIREKKFRYLKQADGVFSIAFPEDLAPSFLLLANRYYDLLEEITGIKGGKFFWAFCVSGEEMLICSPSLSDETLGVVVATVHQRQEELMKRPEMHQIIRIEPMVILREGMTFPAPTQPSPKR
ncbi:MAG: hypothetical protein V1861_06780 [Candidatus Micrarchaeota archaeon]